MSVRSRTNSTIDQLMPLTNPRDALRHAVNVLQTNNVDAVCDKLATELS